MQTLITVWLVLLLTIGTLSPLLVVHYREVVTAVLDGSPVTGPDPDLQAAKDALLDVLTGEARP